MTVSERAEAIFTTGSLQAPEFASLVGNIATAITATAKAQAEATGAQGSYARPLVPAACRAAPPGECRKRYGEAAS